MRYQELNELMGVKRFANMSTDQIIKFIQKEFGDDGKMKVLGTGANGVAIEVGGVVFKMWMHDSAYSDFIKFVQSHPDNPFLPKLLSGVKKMPAFFLRHEEAGSVVNYVKMEKLEPISSMMSFGWKLKERPDYADDDESDNDTGVYSANLEDVCWFMNDINPSEIPITVRFCGWFSSKKGMTYKADEVDPNFRLLLDTLYEIKYLNRSHSVDLHSGNFMKRGKQLVILDPITNPMDMALNNKLDRFNKRLNRKDADSITQAAKPSRRT